MNLAFAARSCVILARLSVKTSIVCNTNEQAVRGCHVRRVPCSQLAATKPCSGALITAVRMESSMNLRLGCRGVLLQNLGETRHDTDKRLRVSTKKQH